MKNKAMGNQYLTISEICAPIRMIWANEINQFEKEFAEYIGCKYALATSYGRTAIYLALKTIGVEDKEVLVPVLTCSVVRDAVVLAGARPIFVDINPANLNMIISDAKKKLTGKTVAIIYIHYYGNVCTNIEKIQSFAKQHHLIRIEDCAHSLGAEHNDRKIGNFGDMSIFSLTKNTLNFGGGMLCTNQKTFYEKAKNILKNSDQEDMRQKIKHFYSLLNYGYKTTVDKIIFDRPGKSIFKWWLIDIPDIFPGIIFKGLRSLRQYIKKTERREIYFYNVKKENIGQMEPISHLRMHPIVASVGRVQFKKIDDLHERRITIAQKLKSKLPNYYRNFSGKNLNNKNVYTYFPLWFKGHGINELVKKCRSKGLLLRKSWPGFQEWWQEQDTKNVRAIRDNLLLLEINPMVTDKEIDRIVKIIKETYAYQQ